MRMLKPVWIPALLCLTASGAFAQSRQIPAVFSDLPYEVAVALSVEQEKLLLIDARADWCEPDLSMDRLTWSNPNVVDWVEENAIAITIDSALNPDVFDMLWIEGCPTVIAFRDGAEFDRIEEFLDPYEFLAWLKQVHAGRSRFDIMRDAAARAEKRGGEAYVDARYELAEALWEADQWAEAAPEYAWMWQHAREHHPESEEYYLDWMSSETRDVIDGDPEQRDRFVTIRDSFEELLEDGESSFADLRSWVHLNIALDDLDRVEQWVMRVKDRETAEDAFGFVGASAYEALRSTERWESAGHVIADPIDYAQTQLAEVDAMRTIFGEDAEAAQFGVDALESAHCSIADLYVSLLSAGRSDDAAKVASAVFVREDEAGAAKEHFVRHANRADLLQDFHVQWLNEARRAGVRVDPDLIAAVKGEKPEPPY